LFATLFATRLDAGVSVSVKSLAKVSSVTLNGETKLSFQPSSNEGFVVVAIQDCALLINGKSTTLRAGDYTRVPGKQSLELVQSGPITVPIVLVEIVSAQQPLTINATTLAPNGVLEDASDRNSTLLVAIDPLLLRDVRDLAEEGEPWKSSPQRKIELQKGQTVWLKKGIHRVRNAGSSEARFVTIEW
jgi:hypothetical protein